MHEKMTTKKAVLLLALLMSLIFSGIFLLKLEPHIPLAAAVAVLAAAGLFLGIPREKMRQGMINGIMAGLMPIIILGLIGMIIGAWMISGTVPVLLSAGFEILHPSWFLISALFISILVSTFTGSAFTTVGTVGVALLGIAAVLGIEPALAAGAVISGAAFGDKMSPLSDTTNFASGIAGVDLNEHIRHMLWTTLPALIITAGFFAVIGDHSGAGAGLQNIKAASAALGEHFNLSYWALLSPFLVMVMAMRRVPSITVLLTGVGTALLTAFFLQQSSLTEAFAVLQHGYEADTGNQIIDGIVNRGGLQSMMWPISLIMIALAFGGMLQEMGVIEKAMAGAASKMKRDGDLITATAASSVGVNLVTGEQYLSILLPGQTFQPLFAERGVAEKNLSRTLEDAGTLINPLIPWGVSGAFFASTLGVPVAAYAPFAVFLYLSPVFSIILGYSGFGLPKTSTRTKAVLENG
ncbi:Na+/H+ antiporter NhaC [Bacillus marinisedimentorum]|uniref:Na+/H+ antiporter NhaC n=1 Tax=Bacillus marinisedimentorum TaxID=1821260 RepID=UPI0007E195F6|nr:Na+/H+ antiporter NhaC [Bacillus marinisedimentorum]